MRERARALLGELAQLPVIPERADQMLQISARDDVTIEELLEVIERDPVLSAMVLRVVNSAAFGLGRSVTNLSQALVLLGTSHVRSVALAAAMASALSSERTTVSWRNSFAVACISRTVAHQVAPNESATAFACGLLHDVGDIVLQSQLPEEAEKIDRLVAEGRARLEAEVLVLGTDHPTIGAALAEHWGLPPLINDVIEHHHDWAGASGKPKPSIESLSSEVGRLTAVVAIAEAIWVELDGNHYSAEVADVGELAGALQLKNLDELLVAARDDVDRHLGATGMAPSASSTLA
jgi:putative nucleotidyltransferase with HDIG domain